MIITKLVGGLGNQMYQYAVGRRLAWKHNTVLKLDISEFQRYKLHKYSLGAFNIQANFAGPEEIAGLTHVRERHFHFDPEVMNLDDNVYLDGYWQSWRYFADIADIIQREFTVKTAAAGRDRQLSEQIASTQSVSLHIRRGDYVSDSRTQQVHGSCDIDYYLGCVDELTKTVRNPHFFIFSDDPQWARENLKLNFPTTLVDHNGLEKNYEDLRLMSQCKHHIIANSTFSLWAALLNPKSDKMVFAPRQWFNASKNNTKDVLPENWIKAGSAKFSIIMANYNNEKYIAEAIESVQKQTFEDWELIIVEDCSTDNSLEVIKPYLADSRIRLVPHPKNRGYTPALKTGIANVRSDYFGILDSDDCLLENAVETMYQCHISHPNHGMIYSQFVACYPDMSPRRIGYCDKIEVGTSNLEADKVSHFKTFKLAEYLKSEGYDEDILYAEDKDISYRMEEVTQLHFLDESLYLYRELPNSQCREPAKERISLQSWEKSKSNALRRRQEMFNGFVGPNAYVRSADLMVADNGNTAAIEPKFSIIMPNYNNGKYIGQAIKSVLCQSFKEWELIIVDDCSTDNSVAIIEPFLADKRIKLIRHKQNGGCAAVAEKTAVAHVRSGYFGVLDSDDYLSHNAIEVAYNEYLSNPDCGFIYSQLCQCDVNLMPIRKGGNRKLFSSETFLDKPMGQWRTFRLADYLKTEGIDEDTLYAHDLDIIYKMEEVAEVKFVDKVLYLARELPDSQCRGEINLTIGMMARAKAKINALKRRCITVAARDNKNYDDLFRQSLSALAGKHHRDIGRYLEFLGTALRQGVVRCEDMPVKITDNNIEKYTLRLAANVKFRDTRRIMNLVGESERPLVSVYMVTYNTEKYIGKAIDSVLAQTYFDLELIIVDDGSTDNTASIVSSYNDPRIEYVYKEHKNFAAGMNRAIMKAGGKYIIGVDSDDFIAPNYIEKMVACAVKNPDADYLYPARLVLTDEFDSPTGVVWEYMDFPDSSVLPAFLFANGYGPIPNPGSLKKKELFQKAMYPQLDTVEDFDFLCKNALRIKFKKVDEQGNYFYRRLASSNSNKFKARNELMAKTLNDMLSVYPGQMLCPQLGQIQEPMAKRQYFLKYLVDTFYRLGNGNMVKFPQYYRQYGDHYKSMLLQQAGKTPAAAFSAVADSGKQTAADLFRQGAGYLRSSQPAQALDCFDRAAGTGVKIANLHYGRAIALAQLGKIDQARRECQAELQIQPGNAEAKNLLMKICS